MGLKGKLIVSTEVKCGGHLFHDLYQTSCHHISNISPDKIHHFCIHEGESLKAGSIIGWKFNHDGKVRVTKQLIEAIDDEKKSITWKVLEGDTLELYNSFTITASFENDWATWTFVYEKKIEDTPEPLNLLGFMLDVTKDLEAHLHVTTKDTEAPLLK
ncbi:PREDICTED: kirola-like [Nicotiana attenuata]|uniref:Mlp-like protein 43 n=1 Tax=Nicotiana attenuata TaxID=49451 RepID=A0A314KZJ3_NICAT|nr:PREDICTED: kirola-like [Nicotiana attenuata]OIT34154.1 mlp-like protein 43 [Nicotiana attenuata]